MAGIPFPFGLQPARKFGSNTNSTGFNTYQMKNGYAQNVFTGDPIEVSTNGYAKLGGVSGNNNIGVAVGFYWIDDTTRQPREAKYFPSGTSAANGYLEGHFDVPLVKVTDDRYQTYHIKANKAVSVGFNGAYVNLKNEGTGSTITGYSNAEADVSALATDTSVSAGVADLQIVGVYKSDEYVSAGQGERPIRNTWGTDDTVVEVVFARHGFNPVQP